MMKLLRYLAFPLVPIYFIVTWLRNKCFDIGVLKSKSYNFPVICVGNLSTGGTGKSPMVAYIIQFLKDEIPLATLSRGYGRASKGFVLANNKHSHKDLGDESFQYYQNFGDDIRVAVCEDRQNGIAELRALKEQPQLIILDDAFQHRKVAAGFNILLTTFNDLFVNNFVLPTGNLREPKIGYKRANSIIITKCPENISQETKEYIIAKIKPLAYQNVYFSHITYAENVTSASAILPLNDFKNFTLVTGIANPKPLMSFLENKGFNFKHLEYKDHYNFTKNDIDNLSQLDCILTTEKDFVRLQNEESLKGKLFYLPIEIAIDKAETFQNELKRFVLKK